MKKITENQEKSIVKDFELQSLIEIKRKVLLDSCRTFYKNLCKEILIEEPKESFNRWILERHLRVENLPENCCNLPPRKCEPEIGPSILREILEDYPIKINRFSKNESHEFEKYKKGAMIVLNKYKSEKLEKIIINLEMPKKDTYKVLQELNPLWVDLMSKHVEELIIKLNNFCHEKYIEMCNYKPLFEISKRLIKTVKDKTYLSINDHKVILNNESYKKLKTLFEKWNNTNLEKVDYAIFCLVYRYEALFGDSGGGQHAAVVPEMFKDLNNKYSVMMECFASPLNCYFPQFCSIFPDIDCYFGSVGSFFETKFVEGSYECNPPFTEELMLKMVEKIEKSLESIRPLMFVVIVPHWTDSESIIKLDSINKNKIILKAKEHQFINGLQHRGNREFFAVHDTAVYFLCNDAGRKYMGINLNNVKTIPDKT